MKGLGLIICLVAAATSAGIARAPQVVVADSDFDFGRVLSGTLVEHQFVVKNERDVPLVIDEVRLTPPLTLVGAPSSVAAGAHGVVSVRLDTSKATGLFEGRIVLSMADPDEPNINLAVTGTVYQTVEVVPRPAFFVVTERGQTQEQSIELINHESNPLEIKSVDYPQGHFATRLETIEAGKRYRLTLRLDGTGESGTAGTRVGGRPFASGERLTQPCLTSNSALLKMLFPLDGSAGVPLSITPVRFFQIVLPAIANGPSLSTYTP